MSTVTTRLAGGARRAWRHPRAARWGPFSAALVCALAGLVVGGPVAAGVLAAYGATGFALVRGFAVRRSEERAVRLAADAVVGLAADLRAGSVLVPAWQSAEGALRQAEAAVLRGSRRRNRPGPVGTVTVRVVAAVAVANACGAPLADVLDRLDTHLRAADRARAVADSQAAGARVSAALLAAMPVAGVGLGIVVGIDPWRVLLHTSIGIAALVLAVLLQLAGVVWAVRLSEIAVPL